jgi:pro-sigmaK processing inhibitor BofA
MLNVIFILLGISLLYYFIKALLKCKSPLKKAALSMLSGVAALLAVNLVTGLLGAQVAVNFYTVFTSLVLGVPGVVLILVKVFLI